MMILDRHAVPVSCVTACKINLSSCRHRWTITDQALCANLTLCDWFKTIPKKWSACHLCSKAAPMQEAQTGKSIQAVCLKTRSTRSDCNNRPLYAIRSNLLSLPVTVYLYWQWLVVLCASVFYLLTCWFIDIVSCCQMLLIVISNHRLR